MDQDFKLESRIVHVGVGRDKATGSVSTPIYQTATFQHEAFGRSTGFDYSRTSNPTRLALEEAIADLEQGSAGFAFASGMAAIACIMELFRPEDHLVVTEDLYGGTYRLFQQILLPRGGPKATFVDTSNLDAVRSAIRPETRGLFVETPTNPILKIADLKGLRQLADEHGLLLIVDNTFLTPFFQQPLQFGADIVVHSASKYLSGHNDVVAGLVAVRDRQLAERVGFLQNAIGGILGPQDSWLVLRGIKTLAVRMERHASNALRIAQWLSEHPLITEVYYPGLEHHPGHDIQQQQARGNGGMVSFRVVSPSLVPPLLSNLRLILFAESLGGVESLLTYPKTQTHADIPEDMLNRLGIDDCLLRFSVGIENADDLIADLDQALRLAGEETNLVGS